jgi:hypothetical protein
MIGDERTIHLSESTKSIQVPGCGLHIPTIEPATCNLESGSQNPEVAAAYTSRNRTYRESGGSKNPWVAGKLLTPVSIASDWLSLSFSAECVREKDG